MQYKNIKQTSLRRFHEQVGIMLLLVAVTTSLVSISEQARVLVKQVAIKPVMATLSHTAKENETARMPARYDDVLRIQTISGQ